jgi:hypothetical protein
MLHIDSSTTTPNRERFILDIEEGIPLEVALECAKVVIRTGRISTTNGQKHHCHHTSMKVGGVGSIHVGVFLNRKSERFFIWRESK